MGGFAAALKMIDGWVGEGVVRGASVAVWHGGDIAATHVVGEARAGVPVTPDTVFALASVSKPLTAAAVMRAVDGGHLTLDTPVAVLVPEFGEVHDPLADEVLPQLEALRSQVTVRHLLCHVSGLPENVGAARIRMRDHPDLDTLVDAMCGLPLLSAPGETLRYSNAGYGILGRVVEAATSSGFHAYLQDEILGPLGLDGVALRPDKSWDDRIADVQDASNAGTDVESYNSRYWRSLGIPWGGFFGTPSDLARYAASFLPGQDAPLSPASRQEMVLDHTNGVPGGVHSAGILWPSGAWGLGWEVAAGKRQHWTGTMRSPETWCHWGQSGTLVWADPTRSLALAVFANRTVRQPWPLRPPRWLALSDAVVEAADSAG